MTLSEVVYALGKKKLKKREYNRRQDDGPEPPKIDRPPAQYDNIRSPYGIASDFNSKPK